MIKAVLIDNKDSQSLEMLVNIENKKTLLVSTIKNENALWKTAININAVTVDIINPLVNQSIVITDIIITSGKKVPGSTVVFQISDGVNTEILLDLDNGTETLIFSHAFQGGIKTWKDAIVQIVTDTNLQDVKTFCAYLNVKTEQTKSYDEWNAERGL